MNRIAIIAAAAVSASFMAATPAAAENVSTEVFFGDLNTRSDAGVKTLAQRVEKSVKLVCERPDPRNLRASIKWEECRQAALAEVSEQLAQQGVVPTVTVG